MFFENKTFILLLLSIMFFKKSDAQFENEIYSLFLENIYTNTSINKNDISYIEFKKDSSYILSKTKLFNEVLLNEIKYSNVENYPTIIESNIHYCELNLFIYTLKNSFCSDYLKECLPISSNFKTVAMLSYYILIKDNHLFVLISNKRYNDSFFEQIKFQLYDAVGLQ